MLSSINNQIFMNEIKMMFFCLIDVNCSWACVGGTIKNAKCFFPILICIFLPNIFSTYIKWRDILSTHSSLHKRQNMCSCDLCLINFCITFKNYRILRLKRIILVTFKTSFLILFEYFESKIIKILLILSLKNADSIILI